MPDPNQRQAQWLLENRLVSQPIIQAVLQRLREQPSSHTDLCDSLLRQGILDHQTAERARSAANLPNTRPRSDPRKEARDLPQLPETGQRFAEFLIEKELGRGGMGRVYLARTKDQPRALALKILATPASEPQASARFQREVKALINLKHPNIIQIIGAGTHQELLYFAMEYVECQSLSQLLESDDLDQNGIPIEQLRKPFIAIARALDHAHQRGIIHRDIKPDNILLENDSLRPVLLDFGLTKSTHQHSQSIEDLTQSGTLAGTPAYMAPEQIPGSHQQAVSPKTDVWGLAATIFTLNTGIPPFHRSTLIAILNAITEAPPPKLRSINPQAPRWLEKLLQHALAKDPNKRPSMEQFARALELQRAPIKTSPVLLAILAALLLASSILAAAFQASPGPKLLALDSPQTHHITAKNSIPVAGLTNRPNTPILVNKQPIKTDEEGRFLTSIKLPEKRNLITIRAQDKNQTILARRYVTRDTIPPRITIQDLQNNRLLAQTLRGQILDEHPQSITINDNQSPIDRQGRFSIPLTNNQQELRITAKDKAGNLTHLTILARTPTPKAVLDQQEELRGLIDRFRKQQSVLADAQSSEDSEAREALRAILDRTEMSVSERTDGLALANRRSWSAAAPDSQERALRLVARLLAPHFVLDRRPEQRGSEGEAALGIFREQETGLELVLVPGAMVVDRHPSSPGLTSQAAILEELGHPLSSFRFLRHVLAYLWVKSLAAACADHLLANLSQDLLDRHQALEDSLDLYRKEREKAGGAETEALNQAEAALGTRVVLALEDALEEWPPLKERFRILARRTRASNRSLRVRRYLPPYLLGRREVSFAVWARFDGVVPERERGGDLELPARRLTATAIEEWLARRSAGLRLPRFSEWRNASASEDPFPWGPDRSLTTERTWTIERAQRQAQPSGPRPQAYGALDLLGNIEEWIDPEWQRWREAWIQEQGQATVDNEQNRAMFHSRRLAVGGAFYYPRELARFDRPRYQQRDDADLRSFRVARGLFDGP